MSEQLVISIVGGAIAGAAALIVGSLILRYFGYNSPRAVDLYFEDLDEPKRDMRSTVEGEGWGAATPLRILLLYGAAVAVGMAAVLRLVLAAALDSGVSAIIVILTWLVVAIAPLAIVVLRRAKRLVALEIAMILELVARSQAEQGDTWIIRCTKKVLGADIFGEEEEDRLDLRISRTDMAPITLDVKGRVVVAPAGLDRTVRKRGLRELRLKGWFVNEMQNTEAEIEHTWSLHDSTYADISDDLAWAVEALGFPLRNVRLSKNGTEP